MNPLKSVSIAMAITMLAGCHKPENEATAQNTEAPAWNATVVGMSAADAAADENLAGSNNMAEAAEGEVRQ
jgi:uncharacterized lipoprotein YajG